MSINAGMFTSNSDLWETPQDLFDKLNSIFHFDLDVCAVKENAKCKRFYTPEQDGLTKPWDGVCNWCNPPYGRQISEWVKKAYHTAEDGRIVVMLLPARTDTHWFHDYIYYGKSEIHFIRGRLKFGNSKNSAPFPSMIVVFKPRKKEGKNKQ